MSYILMNSINSDSIGGEETLSLSRLLFRLTLLLIIRITNFYKKMIDIDTRFNINCMSFLCVRRYI